MMEIAMTITTDTKTGGPARAAGRWTRVASAAAVRERGTLTVSASGNAIALFAAGEAIYAVDNRCPHMGFPLDRGTVRDCILTCHWHHARFDLATGGTFDQWADDVRSFPVDLRAGEVWVDLTPPADPRAHFRKRLGDGLARNIRLVIAKSVLGLLAGASKAEASARAVFAAGLDHGARNRRAGWGSGQTINVVMANLLPHLEPEDRPRALAAGLTAVARDCDGQPARFAVDPLPGAAPEPPVLVGWFRRFIEVRDSEGAERCVATAVRSGHPPATIAGMLFTAATDHRFLDVGHVLDFTNKAFEALDGAGWEHAGPVLASLMPLYAGASREEESNRWRYPVDLPAILEAAFARLPEAIAGGRDRRWDLSAGWAELVPLLLGDDPSASSEGLLAALVAGATFEELAQVVAYAALRRVAQFHTRNEFGDWNTVHHTFTYANALHQAIRRRPSPELLRGVWDAAMSVYLDRFLNVPAARLPEPAGAPADAAPDALRADLLDLFDRQQQVNEAGARVARYLAAGGAPGALIATLGTALLREDAGFHPTQSLEAAVRQYSWLAARPETAAYAPHALIAAARFLAAHFPTPRAADQTFQIALRLHRGEKLFEE
jgi:nitrite reductase/ring-hydroxylating ferredoxin subunit